MPSGRICTRDAIRVKGTLTVERDATLYARRVHVVGNVRAENARNDRRQQGRPVQAALLDAVIARPRRAVAIQRALITLALVP